jgi:hypothetical protein
MGFVPGAGRALDVSLHHSPTFNLQPSTSDPVLNASARVQSSPFQSIPPALGLSLSLSLVLVLGTPLPLSPSTFSMRPPTGAQRTSQSTECRVQNSEFRGPHSISLPLALALALALAASPQHSTFDHERSGPTGVQSAEFRVIHSTLFHSIPLRVSRADSSTFHLQPATMSTTEPLFPPLSTGAGWSCRGHI